MGVCRGEGEGQAAASPGGGGGEKEGVEGLEEEELSNLHS